MQQKINLYTLLPKKAKSRFTWEMLYAVYGIFVFLLVLQWGNALWQKHQLVRKNAQAVIAVEATKQQLDKLTAQYPSIDTKNIQTMAESMRAELNNQLMIIHLLTQSSKFSAYLQGLAEASIPDVWLTQLSFSAAEPHIVVKGAALQALLAQQFLERLLRQPMFTSLPFKINELHQSRLGGTPIFVFRLTTPSTTQ